MKVVILAGGQGTRISEYTKKIPKPMIQILKKPIIVRIIEYYSKFNFKEFIIAGGYKSRVIKDYLSKNKKYKNIKIVQTGVNSLTGDRIVKLKKYLIKEKNFLLTYGDGVSNVNIIKLLKFHLKHGKIATVTGVRPPVKFGELSIGKNDIVEEFVEKPQLEQGWINGGFFVLNNKIFNYLKGRNITFERTPLEKLCKHKQLKVFKHYDYWMCMDNLNEKNTLDKLFKKFKTIWNFKFKKK